MKQILNINNATNKKHLILSLDVKDIVKAKYLIDIIADNLAMIKIGHIACSNLAIDNIRDICLDIPLFLDMKFLDIPNTNMQAIAGYVKKLPNITYFTFHGAMQADDIVKIVKNDFNVIAVAVLVLSSNIIDKDVFLKLAEKNYNCGVRNFVCPALYLSMMKAKFDDVILFSPGIRAYSTKDDHHQVCDAKEAIDMGANYIIVGRPLLESNNLLETIKEYI